MEKRLKKPKNQQPAEFVVICHSFNSQLHHVAPCTFVHHSCKAILCCVMRCLTSCIGSSYKSGGSWRKNTLYSLSATHLIELGLFYRWVSMGFCGTRWCFISAKALAQWRRLKRLSRVSSTHGFGCEHRPNMDIVVVATFQDYHLVKTNNKLLKMVIYSGFPHLRMVIFHSYVSLPEGKQRVLGNDGKVIEQKSQIVAFVGTTVWARIF